DAARLVLREPSARLQETAEHQGQMSGLELGVHRHEVELGRDQYGVRGPQCGVEELHALLVGEGDDTESVDPLEVDLIEVAGELGALAPPTPGQGGGGEAG